MKFRIKTNKGLPCQSESNSAFNFWHGKNMFSHNFHNVKENKCKRPNLLDIIPHLTVAFLLLSIHKPADLLTAEWKRR